MVKFTLCSWVQNNLKGPTVPFPTVQALDITEKHNWPLAEKQMGTVAAPTRWADRKSSPKYTSVGLTCYTKDTP